MTAVLALLLARPGDQADPAPAPTAAATALPPVAVPPPPEQSLAGQRACQELLVALPTTVGERAARPVRSSSPYVAAWGEPPVVLRCGVPLPAGYRPDAEVFVINGVRWLPVPRGTGTVWTALDRSVYVEVTAPASVGSEPVARLSTAISRALPAR